MPENHNSSTGDQMAERARIMKPMIDCLNAELKMSDRGVGPLGADATTEEILGRLVLLTGGNRTFADENPLIRALNRTPRYPDEGDEIESA